jgi:hypothetical protein
VLTISGQVGSAFGSSETFLINFLQLFSEFLAEKKLTDLSGNTKGGSINVLLTSCLTGLESAV